MDVTGWHRHRHHAGPQRAYDTTNEEWGLLLGHHRRRRILVNVATPDLEELRWDVEDRSLTKPRGPGWPSC